MEVNVAQLVLAAAVAAVASSVATVLVLKTDMRWIKRAVFALEERTARLEGEVLQLKRN